jgi:hypothetical protein
MNYHDLKKRFISKDSNLPELTYRKNSGFVQRAPNNMYTVINSDYLNWRFFSYPNGKYIIVDDENCYSIGRLGNRGKLTELQILFVNPGTIADFSFKSVLKAYKNKIKFDLISFPVSRNNSIRKHLKRNFFIKVPNRTNVCYKLIDKSFNIDMTKLALNAINYHTY